MVSGPIFSNHNMGPTFKNDYMEPTSLVKIQHGTHVLVINYVGSPLEIMRHEPTFSNDNVELPLKTAWNLPF